MGIAASGALLTDPNQGWLPFEDNAEFQAARAEAEAEAQAIVEKYADQQNANPEGRAATSFPKHLHREERIMPADAALATVPRTALGN